MIHVAANLDLSMAHAVDICEILPICLDLVGNTSTLSTCFMELAQLVKLRYFLACERLIHWPNCNQSN